MGRYGGNDLTKLSRDVKDSGANIKGREEIVLQRKLRKMWQKMNHKKR